MAKSRPPQLDSQKDQRSDTWLKMKELTLATGLPKSTIHFYAQEGLMPPPVKTSPNMAYYHPSCVERLLFIKEIQAVRELPLKAIKRLLKEKEEGREIAPMLELQDVLFGQRDRRRVNAPGFRSETGLTNSQMKMVSAAGIILPLEDGRYDHEDLEIGKLLRKAFDLGLNPDELTFINDLGQPIIDKQMAYRYAYTKDLSFEEDAVLTKEVAILVWAITPYVLRRILQRRLIKIKGLKDPTLRPDKGSHEQPAKKKASAKKDYAKT